MPLTGFPWNSPTQDKLYGVWGYVSDSIHKFYAVGENGLVINFDGSEWTTTGNLTSFRLHGIWGSSGNDIFTVGEHGTIFNYGYHNGSYSWEDMQPGFTTNLNEVWGTSATDVYAVGDGGFITHYDGYNWSTDITSGTTANLNGVWGNAPDNYVAVGRGGTIVHYNGGPTWAGMTSGTTADLGDVWGSASNDIYAVGEKGTIRHYNGSGPNWSAINSPTSATLRSIWGSAADNIYAVGEYGTILYYDGTGWTKQDSGTQDSLISTFGTLNPRVMVVGYDGNIFNSMGPSVQGRICNACTGVGINHVFVELDKGLEAYQTADTNSLGIYPPLSTTGSQHSLLFTVSGYLPQVLTVELPSNYSVIDHATYLVPTPGYEGCLSGTITRTVSIGNPPKENARGVQNIKVILYQNNNPIKTSTTDEGGNYHFTDVSAGGNYKIMPIITASECSTSPAEYTGITVPTTSRYSFTLQCPATPPSASPYWIYMNSGTTHLLHGIWGSSVNNIFAVGAGGTIIRYNGSNWSPQTSTVTTNLNGVWGSSATTVYAVGIGGKILKTINGGSSWSSMTNNDTRGLNAVWGSPTGSIFAVGDDGTIRYYDGDGDNNGSPDDIWEFQDSHTTVKLLGVFGTSATDVYAVGNSHMDEYWKRTVIHYDGSTWSLVETGNGITLMSAWGKSATDVKAVGCFGSIMSFNGTDWKQSGGPTEKTFNAMWGEPGGEIFAVGSGGVIAHYDGEDWCVRKTDSGNELYGIWGATSTNIFAVGDKGTVIAYSGDVDGDLVPDITDNCPEIANNQINSDGDSHGDVCDNCPAAINEDQADSDYDTLGNACDNCWLISNANQADSDDDCLNPPYTADPRCGDACAGGPCQADVNYDCKVNLSDLVIMKSEFNTTNCNLQNPCFADCNGDNKVNLSDLVMMKSEFNRTNCGR